MGGNLDRNGFASGERGGWYGEPDWDAPWHCNNVTLPNHARCETCRHWCGQCLNPEAENRVTRAEDRCMAWQQARDHEMHVNEAIAFWEARSAIANSR